MGIRRSRLGNKVLSAQTSVDRIITCITNVRIRKVYPHEHSLDTLFTCGTATGSTVRNRPGGVQTADAFRAEHTPTSISGGRRLSAESQSVQEGKPESETTPRKYLSSFRDIVSTACGRLIPAEEIDRQKKLHTYRLMILFCGNPSRRKFQHPERLIRQGLIR